MNPFHAVATHWMKKVVAANEFKEREFGADAKECYRFFDGTYEFMYNLREAGKGFVWSGKGESLPKPSFCMTLNKVAELVQIFGPVLYHRNPYRTVTPRQIPDFPADLLLSQVDPMDPMAGQMVQQLLAQSQAETQQIRSRDSARADVLQRYLNWTPEALDLKREMRWAIDEALIKGMGTLWTEPYTPPGSPGKLVGSFFDSVDNLVMDSDPRLMRECKWIARRRVAPIWEVEEKFGIPRGTLRGHFESPEAQVNSSTDPDWEHNRARGKTNDLLVYWEVYSKMGLGGRMSGIDKSYLDMLDGYGKFVYLAVCDTYACPLNLPDSITQTGDVQAIQLATRWQTPFWADDAWPFTPVIFHERPNKLWPMSHMKPALGELKFLNWCYSFVASKIKTTARDFIAIKKSLAEELRTAVLHGQDLELLEIDAAHGTISEAVQFLQHPTFNSDIWKVLEAIEQNFEKRVGLTELMYGESRVQLRSASEANAKANALQVRPDDMAAKVEESAAAMCRREALCARWHLIGMDVAMVLGPAGTQVWDMLISSGRPEELLFGLEYRIEQGSAKKPNKDSQASNMTQAMQNLFTPLWQYAMSSGNTGPVNALISQWAEAMDFDAGPFLVPEFQLPPPPPPGEEGEQPPPEAA